MNAFVQIAGWAILHALWQGCLLVLLAAWGGLFLELRWRHRLDGLMLALCLLLPLLSAWLWHRPLLLAPSRALLDAPAPLVQALPLAAGAAGSWPLWWRAEAWIAPHLPQLVALWAFGAALMALRLAGGHALGRVWVRQGQAPSAPWQSCVTSMAQGLGIRRRVRLLLTRSGATPLTLGLWKPVILLPAHLLTALPPDYLEALLMHELAHVRRLDYLSNLVQGLVVALLFFHPAVWWLSARLRSDREHLSDQLAAQQPDDARRLALALNALDDLQLPLSMPFFPALAARGGPLFQRIQRLLLPPSPGRSPWWLLSLLLIPCAVLALHAAQEEAPAIAAPAALVAQLDALAAQEGVDPQLLRSVAWAESLFNPKARSRMGARGLLQVMPDTARKYGATDLDDPDQVMKAGARFLRVLLDRYQGDVQKAVAAYNCGPEALDAGKLNEETLHYRALVSSLLAAKAVQPATPLAAGELQGTLLRVNGQVMVQVRTSYQGGLRMRLFSDAKADPLGEVSIGQKGTQPQPGSWTEAWPKVWIEVPQGATHLRIQGEETSLGWRGEVRVPLDAAWKTFTFRMEAPKS